MDDRAPAPSAHERPAGISVGGRIVLIACLFTLALASRGDAFLGSLTQLSGTSGCVSDNSSGGACIDGKALDAATGVAVSPDGKNVYVASEISGGVAVFKRSATTGALTQLAGQAGCVTQDGTGGACATGTALVSAAYVTVSADGRNAYVASNVSGSIGTFTRNRLTGALTQLPGTDGCISKDGTGGACTTGTALSGASFATLSPDGRNVYVASLFADAVAVFSRDRTTGGLTQLSGTDGCVSADGTGGACSVATAISAPTSIAVSPDGKFVYVAAGNSAAIAIFARNRITGALTQLLGTAGCVSEDTTGGNCGDATAIVGPVSIALSPDSRHLYVASVASNSVAVFARNRANGTLTQLPGTAGCISDDGTGGLCVNGANLGRPQSIAVSNDGHNVYVAALNSNAVITLVRDTQTGQVFELEGQSGCVSDDGNGGTCVDGRALVQPAGIAVSRDSKHVYVASVTSDAVAAFVRSR